MTRPDDPDYLAQLDAWRHDLASEKAAELRRLRVAWASTLAEVAAAATLAVVLLWVWGAR